MSVREWVLVLPWVLMALVCWVTWVMMRQSRRIVERLEEVERNLDALQDELDEQLPEPEAPGGLEVASEAPAFELPDLAAKRVSSEQFRGRRVLLIFFSPTCAFCQELAPELARLPVNGGSERPLPVLVTTGALDANRALMEEHGIRCPVLLDETGEVAKLYRADGTPAGYLVDEDGLVAKPRADGMSALLALAYGAPAVAQGHQHGGGAADGDAAAEAVGAAAGPGGTASAELGGGPGTAGQAPAPHQVRLPLPGIPQEGIGVGDLIKRMTDKLGIKPCRGCERRRIALNRWVIKGPGRGRADGSR